MSETIKSYTTIAYGMAIVGMLTDKLKKDYPYMEGENMAVLLPERFQNRSSIPPGLLFNTVNEGTVVKR